MFPIKINNELELISAYDQYFGEVYDGLGQHVYIYDVNSICTTGVKHFFVILDECGGLTFIIVSFEEIYPKQWHEKTKMSYARFLEKIKEFFYDRTGIRIRNLFLPQFAEGDSGEEDKLFSIIRDRGIFPHFIPQDEFLSIPVVKRFQDLLEDKYIKVMREERAQTLVNFYSPIPDEVTIRKLNDLLFHYNNVMVFDDELNGGRTPFEVAQDGCGKAVVPSFFPTYYVLVDDGKIVHGMW